MIVTFSEKLLPRAKTDRVRVIGAIGECLSCEHWLQHLCFKPLIVHISTRLPQALGRALMGLKIKIIHVDHVAVQLLLQIFCQRAFPEAQRPSIATSSGLSCLTCCRSFSSSSTITVVIGVVVLVSIGLLVSGSSLKSRFRVIVEITIEITFPF